MACTINPVSEAYPSADGALTADVRSGRCAEVAFTLGYDSASQFSSEYRRQFGFQPRKDGRKLRQANELSDASL